MRNPSGAERYHPILSRSGLVYPLFDLQKKFPEIAQTALVACFANVQT